MKSDAAYDPVFVEANKIYNEGKKDESLKYIDSFFEDKTVPPYTQYRIYFFRNWVYYYSSDYEKSNVYIDSMIYVMEHYKLRKEHLADYAIAYNSKGDYHFRHNDLDRAFECYYKSKLAAQKGKDTCSLGNQTYHLGMVTYRQKNYEDAIKYFKVSYEQNVHCGDDSIAFYRGQELFSNIGLCYMRLRNSDSAVVYYQKALEYIATNRVKFGKVINAFAEVAQGVIYGNMAKIHMFDKNFDTAEQLMLRSLEINEKPGNEIKDAVFVKLNLSEVYGYTKQYDKMLDVLHRIRVNIDTIPDVKRTRVDLEWRYNMYKYHRYTRQHELALTWIDSFWSLRDTLDILNKKLNNTNVSQLLEGQEAQHQNELLKKNQQVSQLYLTITIGLTIMALIIGGLIYVNYRRSRKNVRELTALNLQVNEQKIQLQQTINEKDTILHVVAHDLRDPIGGISYLSKSVLERESDERLKKMLLTIHSTSQSSLALIHELVELSDTVRRTNAWEKERHEVNELVGHIVTTLEFKANDKGQKLAVTLSAEPVYIYINWEKMVRAFCNILSNAIKFSHKGSAIYVSVVVENRYVTIAIKDSGVGIPEKMQATVFDQFSAAKRQGTGGEKSYGLGLSISKKIIEGDGGELWFESEENKGTTFYIKFPVAPEEAV